MLKISIWLSVLGGLLIGTGIMGLMLVLLRLLEL